MGFDLFAAVNIDEVHLIQFTVAPDSIPLEVDDNNRWTLFDYLFINSHDDFFIHQKFNA